MIGRIDDYVFSITFPNNIYPKTNFTSTSFLGDSYLSVVLTVPPSSPMHSATWAGVEPSEIVSTACFNFLPVNSRILLGVSGSEWESTTSAPRDFTRSKLWGEAVAITRRFPRWANCTTNWPTEDDPPQTRISVRGSSVAGERGVGKDWT